MKKLLPLSALLILPGFVSAEDAEKSLKVDGEVGVLLTSGNTESTALKAKLDVKQDLTRWKNNYILEGLYKEDQVEFEVDDETITETQKTAEKYFASVQTDFKLDKEHRGLFIFGSYEVDQFSGFDYQSTIAGGYSDRLFENDQSHFDYSVGPGYSVSQEEDYFDDDDMLVEGEAIEAAVVRISLSYLYNFSENAKFTQTIASDAALESGKNTKTRSVSAVTAQLSNSFSLRASYSVTHNSEVPSDRENLDAQTSITLVYSY